MSTSWGAGDGMMPLNLKVRVGRSGAAALRVYHVFDIQQS